MLKSDPRQDCISATLQASKQVISLKATPGLWFAHRCVLVRSWKRLHEKLKAAPMEVIEVHVPEHVSHVIISKFSNKANEHEP